MSDDPGARGQLPVEQATDDDLGAPLGQTVVSSTPPPTSHKAPPPLPPRATRQEPKG